MIMRSAFLIFFDDDFESAEFRKALFFEQASAQCILRRLPDLP